MVNFVDENRKETKSSVAVICFLPGRAKDLSAPLKEEGAYDGGM